MNNIFSICTLFLMMFSLVVEAVDLYPRLRPENEFIFPKNFRIANAPYLKNPACDVSREGLDELAASASGQFSEKNFEYLVNKLPTHIIVIDLRRESHGFINGCAVSWKLKQKINNHSYIYNLESSAEEIEKAESQLLQGLVTNKIEEYKTDDGSVPFLVETIATERQLVERFGCAYVRLPILQDQHPSDEETDQIIALLKSLSKNSWMHFHDAGGDGRSTTLMCMLDMMLNSHLSAEAIMRRHEAIGGSNLYDPETYYANKPPDIPRGLKRREFLFLFHQYCLENPNFEKKWSLWVSEQNQ